MIKEIVEKKHFCDHCNEEINIVDEYAIEVAFMESDRPMLHFHKTCFDSEVLWRFSGSLVKIYEI